MGPQLKVLLLPEDVASLEIGLAPLDPKWIPYGLQSSRLTTIPTAKLQHSGKEDLKLYLAREEDLNLIRIRSLGDSSGWTVDSLRSPVVEFSRCFFDGVTLVAGRFFYDLAFLDQGGSCIHKEAGFLTWAEHVFRVLRKTLCRHTTFDAYVGPYAKEWLKGKLIHATNTVSSNRRSREPD